MNYLLKALHEDLNLVTKKPSVRNNLSDDRDDTIVFKEHWENFLLRNQSIIVDFFYGIFKCSMFCKGCKR